MCTLVCLRAQLAGQAGQAGLMSQLHEALGSLWQLWELVLSAQPLLVFAPSPAISADAVVALVSLIYPVGACLCLACPLVADTIDSWPTVRTFGRSSTCRTPTSSACRPAGPRCARAPPLCLCP